MICIITTNISTLILVLLPHICCGYGHISVLNDIQEHANNEDNHSADNTDNYFELEVPAFAIFDEQF
jgi:hypothetical protein